MNGCYFNAISQNSQLPVTFITFDNKTYVQKENLIFIKTENIDKSYLIILHNLLF